MAENSTAEPERRGPGRPFPKGTSGNPGGRPRRVRELEAAIEEAHAGPKALEVIDKLRDLALGGDVQAAKAYLDRVLGPARARADVLPIPTSDKRSLEKILTSARGLLAGQVAALEQKARDEGLTEAELSTVTEAVKAIRAADQDLVELEQFGEFGLRSLTR